jgi:hypothetical protein
MLSKLRHAIKNPFDLKNFYLLFLVAVILLLVPTIIVELASKEFPTCKPSQLRFNGDLASGKGDVYQFTYSGPNSCKLMISPNDMEEDEMSLWVYKPDRSIDVVDLSTSSGDQDSVVTSGNQGTYQLSIRNKDSSKTQYQLNVTVLEAN